MIVYKLTDKNGYCRRNNFGETLYEVGKTYTSDGKGDLCTRHWRHAYEHPLLAVLHDPAHGNYGITSRMWKCDTLDGVIKRDGQLKLGTSKLKVLREIEKPQVTTEQRIAYAIACSLRVCVEESYVKWAENWLSGKDRSKRSAMAAESAAAYAAESAAVEAVGAAYAAANASSAAVEAVEAAYAAANAASAATAAHVASASWRLTGDVLDLLDCAREIDLIE